MNFKKLINAEQVSYSIAEERKRQDEKWGIQRHEYSTWLTILVEEVGEVAQAIQSTKEWGKPSDKEDLFGELIQVAAVASAIAEQVLEEREREE